VLVYSDIYYTPTLANMIIALENLARLGEPEQPSRITEVLRCKEQQTRKHNVGRGVGKDKGGCLCQRRQARRNRRRGEVDLGRSNRC
jgi:hypothetical protein